MKILLIEDDKSLSQFLKEEFTAKGNIFDLATDGADGSFKARTNAYDVIILDYSLPKKDGIAVCKEIRNSGNTTPIIFLSATNQEQTKVEALDIGADDYMTKPFSIRELHSRLKALSRRKENISPSILQIGDMSVDINKQLVLMKDKEIKLSKKEFSLLEFLLKNRGKIVSRAEIIDHVWSADVNPFSNTVEAHVRLLRKKLRGDDKVDIIRNISGRGYIIE